MDIFRKDDLVKGIQEDLSIADGNKRGDRQLWEHILPDEAAVMGGQGVVIVVTDIDFFTEPVKAQIKMDVGLRYGFSKEMKAMGNAGTDQQNTPGGAGIILTGIFQQKFAAFHIQKLIIQDNPCVDMQGRADPGGGSMANIGV